MRERAAENAIKTLGKKTKKTKKKRLTMKRPASSLYSVPAFCQCETDNGLNGP